MDAEAKRTRDLENFLRKALEVELEDPERQLTEEDLKNIALKSGLTEEDWDRLQAQLQAHLDKGRNFLEYGNHEDAVTELDQAAILAPYRAGVIYSCGEAHLLRFEAEGNEESGRRAVELFERCLELEPRHEGAAEGVSRFRHRKAAKKKVTHRVLAAAAALFVGIGGFYYLGNSLGSTPSSPTVELPAPQPASQPAFTNLNVQQSGNLVAIPRFSTVKPAFPSDLPNDIVQIEAGFTDSGHVLALRENGEVLAWGANVNQQADVPDLKKVTQVAAGWRHSLALQEDGTVVAWGDNSDGQCEVPEGLDGVIQISAGTRHSVALKSDGTVVAWGANQMGQCDVPAGLEPVVRLAELCGDHTVVITEDGKLAAWGSNGSGETAVPDKEIGNASVVKVWAGVENFALLDDHRLLHWGTPLRNEQLPRETTGVADVFSGYPAAVLLQKMDQSVGLYGAAKDNPGQEEEFKKWRKVVIAPSFLYGLSDDVK